MEGSKRKIIVDLNAELIKRQRVDKTEQEKVGMVQNLRVAKEFESMVRVGTILFPVTEPDVSMVFNYGQFINIVKVPNPFFYPEQVTTIAMETCKQTEFEQNKTLEDKRTNYIDGSVANDENFTINSQPLQEINKSVENSVVANLAESDSEDEWVIDEDLKSSTEESDCDENDQLPSKPDCPLKFVFDSKQGNRGHLNEDRLIVGELIPGQIKVADSWIFAVLDGHGGASAARYVKASLVDVIAKEAGFFSNDSKLVEAAISQALLTLQTKMSTENANWPRNKKYNIPSTSGTTVSLVVIRDKTAYVHWVGDSPIFVATGDGFGLQPTITNVATPHNFSCPEELERITRSGGRLDFEKKRVCGHFSVNGEYKWIPFLNMTRALGNYWSLVPETNEYAVSSTPSSTVFNFEKLNSKYRFIIICSDGLTEYCDYTELGETLFKSGNDEPFPRVDTLLTLARISAMCKCGTKSLDDMSAICIQI